MVTSSFDVDCIDGRQITVELEKLLGEGSHGSVHLANVTAAAAPPAAAVEAQPTGPEEPLRVGVGSPVAMKCVNFRSGTLPPVTHQPPFEATLRRIRHANVVTFIGLTAPVQTPLHICMEYCSKGDLFEFQEVEVMVSLPAMVPYVRGVTQALDYLHTMNPPILHLDLKRTNVVITAAGVPKLADFGRSYSSDAGAAPYRSGRADCLCPLWSSPEALTVGLTQLTPAADIWSLGCLIIEMVTGRFPWDDNGITDWSFVRVCKYILDESNMPVIPATISANSDALNFVRSCFTRDPAGRPTARALLQYRWIR